MLSREDNELLTRVGPGTPGGTFLRRWWHPIAQTRDVEAGGEPKHVRLLGEDFVLFRVADGRLGLIDEGCPHRCASMALARNEPDGLRCIFHSWKVGLDGSVLETPSEPRDINLGSKVRHRTYRVHEANRLIWAFVGGGDPPPFPAFGFTSVPENQIDIAQVPGDCNWVQLLEGQVDSAHLSHLHSSSVTNRISALALNDRGPVFDIEQAPWGFHIGAIRNAAAGGYYTRVTEFVWPYWEFIPPTATPDLPIYEDCPRFGVCQVPVDDEHTTVWYCMWRPHSQLTRGETGAMWEVWNQEWQERRRDYKWAQDRTQMRDGHFTGLPNLLAEDMAVAESMKPIVDRTREYLGSSDTAVARFRRLYLDALKHERAGATPACATVRAPYEIIHGHGLLHPEMDDWKHIYRTAPA
jgi:phenylpropionate dioxygenase-like ring-hydroxylating dioxygenase large terminal subunit